MLPKKVLGRETALGYENNQRSVEMKRMLRTGLVVLGIGIVSLALFNCDLSGVSDLVGDQLLEGTWVRGRDSRRHVATGFE